MSDTFTMHTIGAPDAQGCVRGDQSGRPRVACQPAPPPDESIDHHDTPADRSVRHLLATWRRHQDLRAAGAPIAVLWHSRQELDAARARARLHVQASPSVRSID